MKTLYLLTHEHVIEEDVYDKKTLGLFSSEKKYKEAVAHYCLQPGFREYQNCFIVEIVEADVNDFNSCSGKFGRCAYMLMHEWYDGEYDYVTYLGCYSSHDLAWKAQEHYSQDPEFIGYPNGFSIDEYVVDQMEWKEGFFTWMNKE